MICKAGRGYRHMCRLLLKGAQACLPIDLENPLSDLSQMENANSINGNGHAFFDRTIMPEAQAACLQISLTNPDGLWYIFTYYYSAITSQSHKLIVWVLSRACLWYTENPLRQIVIQRNFLPQPSPVCGVRYTLFVWGYVAGQPLNQIRERNLQIPKYTHWNNSRSISFLKNVFDSWIMALQILGRQRANRNISSEEFYASLDSKLASSVCSMFARKTC